MKYLALLLSVSAIAVVAPPVDAAELLMVEEHGCYWCERWDDEIAPIYPKTTEGKFSPLRRIDIDDPAPADVTFQNRLHYTPTFVLVEDGEELARIEGYPGEDFFWGLLAQMLRQHTDYCRGTTEC